MKIYTRTGDDGTTALFAGGRVSKAHGRVETYGTVDELGSALGVARAFISDDAELDAALATIQNDLFALGGDLATPRRGKDKPSVIRLSPEAVDALEHLIDACEADLAPLTNFILAGGTPVAAHIHLARTICRRAERLTVTLAATGEDIGPLPVRYLNRLSDALFVLGRWANHRAGEPETLWAPRG